MPQGIESEKVDMFLKHKQTFSYNAHILYVQQQHLKKIVEDMLKEKEK